MSAHCNDCGADLVYVEGQYPLMKCAACELRKALIFWVERARRFEEFLPASRAYIQARGVLSAEYELGRRIFEESLPTVADITGILAGHDPEAFADAD